MPNNFLVCSAERDRNLAEPLPVVANEVKDVAMPFGREPRIVQQSPQKVLPHEVVGAVPSRTKAFLDVGSLAMGSQEAQTKRCQLCCVLLDNRQHPRKIAVGNVSAEGYRECGTG